MHRPRWVRGGLWRHADFLRLWTGQSISEFGTQISQLAIPLVAAISLRTAPLEFSILTAAGYLPFVLFALPAGAFVDRLPRRRLLIICDATRALLLALIPGLWAIGQLRMWELVLLQFVVGTFTVFFDVAYMSYLPSLVKREQLVEGNSKLQLTVSVAQVAGPSASGALVSLLTAPYAIVADAASYVASTAFLLTMRHREGRSDAAPDAPKPQLWREVKDGLGWVLGHRWLRAIAMCTGTSNFFVTATVAIFVLYLVRSLHLSPFEIGAVMALGSCGSIGGALVVSRIQGWLGVGSTILGSVALTTLGALAIPLAPPSFPMPVLVFALAAMGFAAVTYNVTQVSLRQTITPERLQGRMNAAMRWVVWGTIPLGSLVGGVIAQAFGLHTALWIGAIGALCAILPIALTSVRSIQEMPQPLAGAVGQP